MIEKILSELREQVEHTGNAYLDYVDVVEIVQEVAKEYGNVEVGEIVMYDGEPFAIETVKCTKEPCRDKMLTMIAREAHIYQKGE